MSRPARTAGRTVVVVGAGVAGLRACEGLRSGGFEGRLVLLGEERHVPYDRPPLSKQFLAGDWGPERLVLRDGGALSALGLDLSLGPEHRAVGLDLDRGRVRLRGGTEVAFDGLVVATGSCPRRLPELECLDGVHVLRTQEDAESLRRALHLGPQARAATTPGPTRLLLVGAGFIGLEVAATARRFGVEVDIVDPLPAPLSRVLPPAIGGVVGSIHRDHGARLHLRVALDQVKPLAGGGVACHLSDGASLEVDVVLVGIGAVPAVAWLEGSRLPFSPQGVHCDAALRVAPGVVACGDVAVFPFSSPGGRQPVRLEHRTSAAELGEHAARTLLHDLGQAAGFGGPGPAQDFETVPYVWSDQYDLKIQVLGLPEAGDELVVVDGTLDSGRFVACCVRAGRLSAAVSFGRPRALMKLRQLVGRAAPIEEALALELA